MTDEQKQKYKEAKKDYKISDEQKKNVKKLEISIKKINIIT